MSCTLSYRSSPWDVVIFKALLLVWVCSIPYQNFFYQASFACIDLLFAWHLLYHKNFNILKSIFQKIALLSIAFIGIILSMVISNLLNPELMAPKTWSATFLFIFRFGVLFISISYFYTLNFFSKKELVYFILISSLIIAAGGIAQLLQNPDIIREGGIYGMLKNRNPFGHFVGIGLAVSFMFLRDNKKLMTLLVPIFAFFVIFSLSRATWLSCFCAIFLYSALEYKKITRGESFVYIIFILLLTFLPLDFSGLVSRLHQLKALDSSLRTNIWEYALELILDKPFFGYGVDSWEKIVPTEMLQYAVMAHNIEVEVLVYTGIFGAFFYFLSIFLSFHRAYLEKNWAVFCLLTYFFVLAQFDQGAYIARQFLSFVLIFVFFAFSDSLKENA